MKLAIFSILCSIISACSSNYYVSSRPSGAIIYDEKNKKLGTTPIDLSSGELISDQAGGVLLRIEKEAYNPIWIWLPNSSNDFRLDVNLTPFFLQGDRDVTVSHSKTPRKSLFSLSDTLLNLQTKLFLGKEVKDEEIERIRQANPTFGSIYFLRAIKKLRENKKKEAEEDLKAAIGFSPKESDFIELINELEAPSDQPNQ